MRHALSLAAHGPVWGVNPRVGCVILSPEGEILAEGWHRGAGTPHAEVDALSKLEPGEARGATAVVTLEPCNHYGRTGPCSEALIAAGVARVVYSVSDPGVASSGGAARLSEAGVAVEGGLLADEVESFLRVWLTATRLGRPFVSVKWASTLDGRAAAADGSSQWITGTAARQRVHEQREQADAILVGTGTVISDDPSLTARGDAGELLAHQPLPVVIGDREIPAGAKLATALRLPGHDLDATLRDLFERGIRHAYVEGGPTLASAFIAAGLVDEFLIFLAPALLGGPRLAVGDLGVESMAGIHTLHIDSIEQLGKDILVTARPATER
ncbi:MAG: DeoR family transcriptional regulator [Microbacteriaceae bacterium]|jgi:diaminohydroxyphosphoribosylaminopyrimidine deaminase/5-amino-6-(5-phosphoribosylamino)uracil reductase|nr:DeoR family transcriptional regulator [Microbacteriaceae bacterium]